MRQRGLRSLAGSSVNGHCRRSVAGPLDTVVCFTGKGRSPWNQAVIISGDTTNVVYDTIATL